MIRLVIFDLDGTLYRGNEVIPGALDAVSKLLKQKIEVRYLTNNSGHTQAQLVAKLTGLGFPCDEEMVYGTGKAAAEYCRDQGFRHPLVIGEPGLHETFSAFGFSDSNTGPADVVVAGICRSFTYEMCDAALQAIRGGATFIATNRDATYPLELGKEQPGAGAIVASIEAATGVTPVVLGKPSPTMIQTILRKANLQPAECIVIGDRMETDIAAGEAAGCQTALVLTGATTSPPGGVRTLQTLSDLNLKDFET